MSQPSSRCICASGSASCTCTGLFPGDRKQGGSEFLSTIAHPANKLPQKIPKNHRSNPMVGTYCKTNNAWATSIQKRCENGNQLSTSWSSSSCCPSFSIITLCFFQTRMMLPLSPLQKRFRFFLSLNKRNKPGNASFLKNILKSFFVQSPSVLKLWEKKTFETPNKSVG